MFADEARLGRINRPRPCWAPIGTRPEVAAQLIREYIYLYGAVSPKDGTCVYLIMPTSNTACFQAFLDVLARKFARQDILLVLDGAPNHRCSDLALPDNISLLFLPPYSPELNPKENLWDEIREKIFKNYALKSIDAVRTKLKHAILSYRAQSQNRKINHVLPLYRQVTLMWKWYEIIDHAKTPKKKDANNDQVDDCITDAGCHHNNRNDSNRCGARGLVLL